MLDVLKIYFKKRKQHKEMMKNDETTPKYVGCVENILQETKTTERK
jgi:hypothetical protein